MELEKLICGVRYNELEEPEAKSHRNVRLL